MTMETLAESPINNSILSKHCALINRHYLPLLQFWHPSFESKMRQSLQTDILSDDLWGQILINGMLCLTSKFDTRLEGGCKWYGKKLKIIRRTRNCREEHLAIVQGLILLGIHKMEQGSWEDARKAASKATRLAKAMELDKAGRSNRPEESLHKIESHSRTYWSCFILERLIIGVNSPPISSWNCRLPQLQERFVLEKDLNLGSADPIRRIYCLVVQAFRATTNFIEAGRPKSLQSDYYSIIEKTNKSFPPGFEYSIENEHRQLALSETLFVPTHILHYFNYFRIYADRPDGDEMKLCVDKIITIVKEAQWHDALSEYPPTIWCLQEITKFLMEHNTMNQALVEILQPLALRWKSIRNLLEAYCKPGEAATTAIDDEARLISNAAATGAPGRKRKRRRTRYIVQNKHVSMTHIRLSKTMLWEGRDIQSGTMLQSMSGSTTFRNITLPTSHPALGLRNPTIPNELKKQHHITLLDPHHPTFRFKEIPPATHAGFFKIHIKAEGTTRAGLPVRRVSRRTEEERQAQRTAAIPLLVNMGDLGADGAPWRQKDGTSQLCNSKEVSTIVSTVTTIASAEAFQYLKQICTRIRTKMAAVSCTSPPLSSTNDEIVAISARLDTLDSDAAYLSANYQLSLARLAEGIQNLRTQEKLNFGGDPCLKFIKLENEDPDSYAELSEGLANLIRPAPVEI
ncbi:uncharacterized protein LY89DRAFT_743011 [Mollisia scopiformis]|uniref:Xylanolytic transcriptional activator regulatory domain-containing protein n=1 Tax=Mollisia scopiformis TaxID=149040 RepID=A0A132B6T3_MOLSC|nr:uncharacterized protein LY89DRAFT_743011 [Mollisia scopiformis]KUJ07387.1 hypothetical protein LY89DRAFT_743011 [Mollisia scopiformis]